MCGVMYECCQGVMRGVENVWPGISMITDSNLMSSAQAAQLTQDIPAQ